MSRHFLDDGYVSIPQPPQPTRNVSETLTCNRTNNSPQSNGRIIIIAKLHKLWRTLSTPFRSSPVYEELPFKATRRPSCYIVLLHLIPVAAVIITISFNLYGYWVGKELSGVASGNAPKQLALQLTAKPHELLMLASLSEALLTHLLNSLALGCGLPFASLVAVNKFKSVSFIWSRDFWAMCRTDYSRRSLLVPLLLVCTMLGVSTGPSSATAMIPRLDVWPAGEAIMTLDISSDLLWPPKLAPNATNMSSCNRLQLGCFNAYAWDSIAANIFSYWQLKSPGESARLPQRVNMPSVSSLRSMDVRLRGSINPSEPAFTLASVQHATTADMINTFRFLTFRSQSEKCKKTWSSAMCSYQDVSWFASVMQPIVFTACHDKDPSSSSVELPVIDWTAAFPKSVPISTTVSFDTRPLPQFVWTGLDERQSTHASISFVVRTGMVNNINDFVCSIQAQWTPSVVSAEYASTDYVISSEVPGMDSESLVTSEFRGRTITVDSEWAQQVVMSTQGNMTAFDHFMQLGEIGENSSVKLETVLAALFAEIIAHIGSGAMPVYISSKNLHLKTQGDLNEGQAARVSALHKMDIALKTSMAGYGYGLHTTTGFSTSVLLAMIVSLTYSTIAIVHLISLYTSEGPYIESWSEERDRLATCLQSRYRPDPWRANDDEEDDDSTNLLTKIVVVVGKNGRAELSFRKRDWPNEV